MGGAERPDTLARHLGELGEIRITRAEPEKRVDWEADGTNGTVLIKPSGWGTKVTLRVTREIEARAAELGAESASSAEAPGHAQSGAEIESVEEHVAEEPALAEAERAFVETESAFTETAPSFAEAEPAFAEDFPSAADLELEARIAEAQREEREPAPMARRGFFARLFGRRRPRLEEPAAAHPEPAEPESAPEAPSSSEVHLHEQPEESPAPEPERSGSAIESLQARFQIEPPAEAPPAPPRAPVDIAAELKAAEEVAAEEVTAVLTAVLDRLGAAHHRPFSRA